MDYREIDVLIEKYWQGETTLEEEKILKEFLNQPELPEKYQHLVMLFSYYGHAASIEMKTARIDALYPNTSIRWYERSWVKWSSVAATIVVLVGISYFLLFNHEKKIGQSNPNDQIVIEDTFDNPDLAYQQAKEALLLLSQKLNAGLTYGTDIKMAETIDLNEKAHE